MGWKEAYQHKVHLQLCEWKETLERWNKAQPAAQGRNWDEADQRMELLRTLLQTAVDQLEELRESRQDQWEFSRQAVERAMINFKQALNGRPNSRKGSLAPASEHCAPQYEQQTFKG